MNEKVNFRGLETRIKNNTDFYSDPLQQNKNLQNVTGFSYIYAGHISLGRSILFENVYHITLAQIIFDLDGYSKNIYARLYDSEISREYVGGRACEFRPEQPSDRKTGLRQAPLRTFPCRIRAHANSATIFNTSASHT